MAKILIMVRTSTEVQSIESQHNEMLEFCKGEGYAEEDMIWVEEQGASAAKMDDAYLAMIEKVKSEVEKDPEIKCFAVWHLNRLARTEKMWVEVKSFFVERQIQIICKNPYLRLLTTDGKVDAGMELAAGLLALLSVQEQEERKAKFKRAKTSMLSKGQYIGGNVIKYGYKVEGRNFVENEEESSIIKLIYELYSTGNYSSYTLAKELNERGLSVTDNFINKTLRCDAYIGEPVGQYGMHYPPIISKELFNKCAEIREANKIEMKHGKRVCLGAKLIKCPTCGATCTSNSKHYVCSRHSHHGPCENGFALRQSVANSLLWRVANVEHFDYLMSINVNKAKDYEEQLKIIDEKINVALLKETELKRKKDRIVESYLDGLIDKEKRDLRLSKLQDELCVHRDNLTSLEERRAAIEKLLNTDEADTLEAYEATLDAMEDVDKYDIIHKHIVKLVPRQLSYGKRDPRTTRPNAVRIDIETIKGSTYSYLYFPKYFNGFNLYSKNRNRWIPDMHLI